MQNKETIQSISRRKQLIVGIIMLFLACLVGSIPMRTTAASNNDTTFSTWAGSFFIANDLAYIDQDTYWDVVDITDPMNMVVIGRTTNIPNRVEDVKVVGNLAYMAGGNDGLIIVDINPSYPTEPVVVSTFQPERATSTTAYSVDSLDVVGEIAYLGMDGLVTVDVSNPDWPRSIGAIDVTPTTTYSTYDVKVIDEIAYIANGSSGFFMLDVSDLANLTTLGSITVGGALENVGVGNGVIYMFAVTTVISMVDITDPANIFYSPTGSYYPDQSGLVFEIAMDRPIEDVMYVRVNGDLYELDVTDPFNPTETRIIDLDSSDGLILNDYYYYVDYDDVLSAYPLNPDSETNVTPEPTAVSTIAPTPTPMPTMTPTPVITEPIELEVRSGLEDVLLRWQVVEPLDSILDHYNVYRYQLGTVIVPVLVSSQLGSHYVDVDDFIAGENYCYYVEAIDDAGEVITSSNLNCTTFGELQLVVPHVVLPPDGTEIAVPVTVLNGNGLCPVSLDITLAYDSSLVAAVDVQQTAYTADYRFESSINQPGRVSIASITGNCDPLAGSGAMFNVLFDVVGDVGAVSSLDFVEGITATAIYDDGEGEPTVLRLLNGSLTVGAEATRGDINGDQFVNAFDAFLALEAVVGAVEPTLQQTISCDVNGDGSCNTADSSLILCFAAYETWDFCDLTPTTRSARRQAMTTLSKGELSGGKLPILIQGSAAVSGGTVTFTYDPALIQLNGVETSDSLIADWSVTTDEETGLLRVAFADDEPMGTAGTLFTINAEPLVEGATVQWAGAQLNDGLGLDWESNLGHTIVYADSAVSVPLAVTVQQQTAWSAASFVGVLLLLLCGLTAAMWRID